MADLRGKFYHVYLTQPDPKPRESLQHKFTFIASAKSNLHEDCYHRATGSVKSIISFKVMKKNHI